MRVSGVTSKRDGGAYQVCLIDEVGVHRALPGHESARAFRRGHGASRLRAPQQGRADTRGPLSHFVDERVARHDRVGRLAQTKDITLQARRRQHVRLGARRRRCGSTQCRAPQLGRRSFLRRRSRPSRPSEGKDARDGEQDVGGDGEDAENRFYHGHDGNHQGTGTAARSTREEARQWPPFP
jgi:hypothetical protein